jgi:hypothetical protein
MEKKLPDQRLELVVAVDLVNFEVWMFPAKPRRGRGRPGRADRTGFGPAQADLCLTHWSLQALSQIFYYLPACR